MQVESGVNAIHFFFSRERMFGSLSQFLGGQRAHKKIDARHREVEELIVALPCIHPGPP
jgi:hypothetical protein